MPDLRALVIAFALAAFPPAVLGQARPLPRVLITLPVGVPSEKVDITYVLYGSFGADGSAVHPSEQASSYPIYASSKGKAAETIKILVWAPGCKIETLDISLDEGSDIQQPFPCTPLPTVTVAGKIQPSGLTGTKPTLVSFLYLAGWACRFFGFADCMVPQFHMGVSVPEADGSFRMELPDFSSNSIATEMGGEEEFVLTLHEAETWNVVAFLEPEFEDLRSPGWGLKVLSSYPNSLIFVEHRFDQHVLSH